MRTSPWGKTMTRIQMSKGVTQVSLLQKKENRQEGPQNQNLHSVKQSSLLLSKRKHKGPGWVGVSLLKTNAGNIWNLLRMAINITVQESEALNRSSEDHYVTCTHFQEKQPTDGNKCQKKPVQINQINKRCKQSQWNKLAWKWSLWNDQNYEHHVFATKCLLVLTTTVDLHKSRSCIG